MIVTDFTATTTILNAPQNNAALWGNCNHLVLVSMRSSNHLGIECHPLNGPVQIRTGEHLLPARWLFDSGRAKGRTGSRCQRLRNRQPSLIMNQWKIQSCSLSHKLQILVKNYSLQELHFSPFWSLILHAVSLLCSYWNPVLGFFLNISTSDRKDTSQKLGLTNTRQWGSA